MDRLGGLWWVIAAGWGWALLLVWAGSDGLITLYEEMGLVVAGGALGLLWLVWTRAALSRSPRAWMVWLSAPAVSVLAVLLAATNLPLIGRLWLSEREMREYAGRHDPDPPDWVTGNKGIGSFGVDKVWRHGSWIAFATDGQPFITAGVMFAPDGLPEGELPIEVEEMLWARYTHLYGPWYRFEVGD